MSNNLTWGGEFAEKALEAEYRARCLPETIGHAKLIYGLGALINIVFYANDWFTPAVYFPSAMMARTVIVVISIVCYFLLAKIRSFRHLEILSLVWLVLVAGACAVLVLPHTESGLFVTLFLPNIFFLALPLSFQSIFIFAPLASYTVLVGHLYTAEFSENTCGLALGMLSLIATLLLVRRQSNRLRHVEWQATRALTVLATTDSLTGLVNRATFFEQASSEIKRMHRYGRPLAVIMVDIDFFKRINDNFGHKVGDMALRAFARLCRTVVRDQDVVARLGGEEFALLLPETDRVQALALADRLREETTLLVIEGLDGAMTISVGVSEVFSGEMTADPALTRADKALYGAKRAGRNRVVQYA